MVTLYGIKNCDTVKKARQWLDARHITYNFHDLRKDGLEPAYVEHWLSVLGADKLINKRSTTWKQLSDSEKAATASPELVDLVLRHPTLIKRPLLDRNGSLESGFKPDHYARVFRTA